ncbi:MAG: hypothetical protein HY824_04080 [Acidobacteria bacterium]|nr:hypothetical protein [Acidobacteriota bacterium]
MRTRLTSAAAVIAGATTVALLWTYATPSSGQTAAYRAPRAADGRPDLNGVWQALNTANYDLQPQPARPPLALLPAPPRPAGPGLSRAIPVELPAPAVRALGAAGGVPAGDGVVEGNDIPYQPWAAARRKENAEHWLERDPEIRCFMPGVPRATYLPYPFQILQGADTVLIAYEFAGTTRTVHLKEVPNNPAPTWMGLSRGRWEGETLVVDVTDFNDQTWFDRAGNFHSEALHVVERYTPVSPYHLMYEATIEDPKVFTRPWKIRMPLYRRFEPTAQIHEYKCTEFVEELMYGPLGVVDPATRQVNK